MMPPQVNSIHIQAAATSLSLYIISFQLFSLSLYNQASKPMA